MRQSFLLPEALWIYQLNLRRVNALFRIILQFINVAFDIIVISVIVTIGLLISSGQI